MAERQNFVIKSATGTLKSACCVTIVPIRIASWTGEHSFVISGAITKYDTVIGRDFFIKHKVKTDHEDDSMLVDGINIKLNVNQTCENANTVLLKDNISETVVGGKSIEERLELIYQELNGLKLQHAEVKAAQATSGSNPSLIVSDSINVEKEKYISQPGL